MNKLSFEIKRLCNKYHLKCEQFPDAYSNDDRIEFYAGTYFNRYLIFRTYLSDWNLCNVVIKDEDITRFITAAEQEMLDLDLNKVDLANAGE